MKEEQQQKSVQSLFPLDWRRKYFAGQPLRIGNAIQFLFDDYVVEDRYGLKRVVGSVEKHTDNPIDTGPAMPWETPASAPRHILYDPEERLYKGWYGVCPNLKALRLGRVTGYHYHTCYAESRDGVVWEKPKLDLFPWNEHAKTNIVLRLEGGTCLLEDAWLNANPESENRRFSALIKTVPPGENQKCIVLMHSPDGRKWTSAPDPILSRGASDGSYCTVYNPTLSSWMLYRRPPTLALKNEGFYDGRVMSINRDEQAKGGSANIKRRASVCMSANFRHWTHPRAIALPDEIDVSDVDSIKVIPYRDVFFGFIGLMDNPGLLPKHTHLMFSRDGLSWERLPERPQFVSNGAPGEWDAGQIMVNAVIPDGERLRLYYSGTVLPQKENRLPRTGGVGLAFIDKDRWIGQQAGPEGGYLLTRQFILEGDRLVVNCRSQVENPPSPEFGGLIRAELLQEPAEHNPAAPYPGFSMEDCDPVEVTDNPEQTMTWKGSPDLSALRGKPVYIRFFLRNATLYTLQIADRA